MPDTTTHLTPGANARLELSKIKDGATLRLFGRAALAGLAGGITDWLSGDVAVAGIVTAAILAAGEVFTPLNPFVGLFKKTRTP